MNTLIIFGENIRKARENRNITLSGLARLSGYNRFDLSTLENGEHDILLDTAVDIARALDRDLPYMLCKGFLKDGNDYFIENDYLSLFIENVKFSLRAKKKYQYSIATLTGIAPENINRIIKKKVKPKIGTMDKFAMALNLELKDLLMRKGGEAKNDIYTI